MRVNETVFLTVHKCENRSMRGTEATKQKIQILNECSVTYFSHVSKCELVFGSSPAEAGSMSAKHGPFLEATASIMETVTTGLRK